MNVLWYYAIGFVIIWALALLFKDKLKIDINGPLLMRRTLRMRDLIDSIAQKSPRFWRIYMNIGIPVSVFFMGLMIYLIIKSLGTFLQAPAASPILPGVDYPGNPIYLPLGYGLIGLATVLVVHEFAHGILARVDGIKIKSIGVLLVAILPGAFVEPDPEGVKKASRLTKLRIYVAGSISNLSFAGIAFLIVFLISNFAIAPSFHSEGIEITSVVPNSPAEGILKEGIIIYNINGKSTNNFTEYTKAINNTKIGEELTFQTNQGTFKVKTGVNPNNSTRAYIGIRGTEHKIANPEVSAKYGDTLPLSLFYINDLFWWIFLLNFAVGTFNLLPIKPLDGGIILEEILSYKLAKKRAKTIVNSISYVLGIFILVSIVYGLGKGILLSL
jgi:membrane-associated protease RseP (regulator of RpoE activity)